MNDDYDGACTEAIQQIEECFSSATYENLLNIIHTLDYLGTTPMLDVETK